MPTTHANALIAIQAMFPGHRVEVCDGNVQSESGVIEADGVTVATFQFLMTDNSETVYHIAIGEVGQYCGTVEEIAAWEAK